MNYNKYTDLAYRSKNGERLLRAVEDRWDQWLHVVQNARWLRTWSKVDPLDGCTPLGKRCSQPHSWIAQQIFTAAVWGYGVAGWRDPRGVEALRTLRRLRSRGDYTTPDSLWDMEYLEKHGVMVPCEFADLDKWLESLV